MADITERKSYLQSHHFESPFNLLKMLTNSRQKKIGKNKEVLLIMMIVFFSYPNYLLSYLLRVFSCTYFHTCDILAHIFSYHTRVIFMKN